MPAIELMAGIAGWRPSMSRARMAKTPAVPRQYRTYRCAVACDEEDMTSPATCGQGLAEHSPLAVKLGELTDAVAENLEIHMTALDLNDEHAKQEHDAYTRVAEAHREVAAQLRATGEAMVGYRALPMGPHDMDVMASPEVLGAYRHLVNVEQELLTMLEHRAEEHQALLEG
jgi:hypothetical protein